MSTEGRRPPLRGELVCIACRLREGTCLALPFSFRTLWLVALLGLLSLAVHAAGYVELTDFSDAALDRGAETEDWQPAFQQAIAAARARLKPLHIPAGEYKIRRPIEILPASEPRNCLDHNDMRIVGDGKYHTIISQQVEDENAIDWTGLTYEEPCTFGRLEQLTVTGGDTALNIKWHNYFTLDSCYIAGAKQYGIYAEGWSSRFVNSTIRWCYKAGIRGGTHFNNNVIRDCYFSRNAIGAHLMNGCYGSRIEGCGFELCAKAAVFLRGCNSFTINNTYFEGNGYRNKHQDLFSVEGSADTVHLDYACRQVTIHDCIFRINQDPEGALIAMAYVIGGHIYDNSFLNGENAIKLRSGCETNENAGSFLGRVLVERNEMKDINQPLVEEQAGLIQKAVERRCAFHVSARRECKGDPTGTQQPECIGDEILDVEAKRWYKAVGSTPSDWVAIN